jgi:aminoglycoside phosphotransferase
MLEDTEAGQSSGSKSALEANEDGIAYLHSLIYVPQVIRKEIIRMHHDLLMSRHQGIKKTHEQISKNYYIPNLQKEVTNYIKNYDSYQQNKPARHKPYG